MMELKVQTRVHSHCYNAALDKVSFLGVHSTTFDRRSERREGLDPRPGENPPEQTGKTKRRPPVDIIKDQLTPRAGPVLCEPVWPGGKALG